MTSTNAIRLRTADDVSDGGLVARRFEIDPFDPWDLVAAVPQHKSYRVFAEPDGPLRVGIGSAIRVARAAGSKPIPWAVLFDSLRASLGPLGELSHAFFTAAFDVGEPFGDGQDWRGFAPIELTVPDLLFELDDGRATLTVVASQETLDKVAESGRALLRSAQVDRPVEHPEVRIEWGDDAYASSVGAALETISEGAAQKIVVARPIQVLSDQGAIPIPALLGDLHRRFPGCFVFAFRPGGSHRGASPTFLGATPERLVAVRDGVVQTGAIAGTAPRGVSARMDERHANELLKSDKERREHEVVGTMIEEALRPFCRNLERDEMRFLKLANVQHLWTPIRGELLPGKTVLDVAEALHPTPAVGGEPRQAAVDAIRRIERWRRGLYAGVCGCVGIDGSGELAVAIRSALVDGSRARLFSGAGIVQGSRPQREVEETRAKARAILDSLETS